MLLPCPSGQILANVDNRSEYSAAVARVVSEGMKAHGLSINALAEATLIPRVTLGRRLGGEDFKVGELAAIAPIIGMTVAGITSAAELGAVA